MSENPYSKLTREESILRDLLAADRTILANERTFLAYIRTALTLFVAGVSFIKFFDSIVIELVGWIFVPSGVLTFMLGLRRYKSMNSLIYEVKNARDGGKKIF